VKRRAATWIRWVLAAAAIVELLFAALERAFGGWVWRLGPLVLRATDPTRPAIAACLIVLVLLVWRAPQPRWLVLVPLVPLLALQLAQSAPRRVGDGAEYVAMAMNLAAGSRPSLTASQIARAAAAFPNDTGFDLVMPELRGADGRQDFPHFWLYPLLAAPFVRAAAGLGWHPAAGFTVLNLLLLAAAVAAILWRAGVWPALLLGVGPVLWWVDKAHTEVLTFAVLTVAIVSLPVAPWWALLALGVGAAQNPALLAAWAVAALVAVVARGVRDRRVWAGAAAGLTVAALHPLYYALRLGRWSGLAAGVDRHWPTLREFTTVVADPNLGIFVLDPVLTAAVAGAVVLLVARTRRRLWSLECVGAAGMALVLLAMFTQTTNVNSGGTPGPSRYGLWLLPLTLPFLADLPEDAGWVRALAAASVIWCAVFFAPRAPDRYLTPTPLARWLWLHHPALDNPVAEVFAERVTGRDPAPPPPVATRGCEKVLLVGRGGQPAWPSACSGAPAPEACLGPGVLCYANRSRRGYTFAAAPSVPSWRRSHGIMAGAVRDAPDPVAPSRGAPGAAARLSR
jgi:hypothetical protein